MNNFYRTPSESFPLSVEAQMSIEAAAEVVFATGKKLSAKVIRKIAERGEVTSEDVALIYRKEVAMMPVSMTAAQALYNLRMDLAQPFSNGFYKDPETGLCDPGEED